VGILDAVKTTLAGVTMAVIFGLSFMFTKNALSFTRPFEFLAFRFGISTVFILMLLGLKVIKLRRKPYRKLLLVAVFQPVLYFIFETLGLSRIPSSEAGIIIATIPIAVAILSPIFLREYPRVPQIPFLVSSVFGVIFMVGMNSLQGDLLGDLLVLGAVLMAASYNIASRKFSKEFKPEETTFVMMLTGGLTFNVLALIDGIDYSKLLIPTVLIGAMYLGIFSSVTAFFLINYMLTKVSPVQSSIFANLTTVVSVLAGTLIRQEQLHWYHLLGMAMILLGTWGVNYVGFKTKTRKEKELT